ncbi:MAG: response regulator transcription factor [Puniceicoccales bacterium]|jgi:two-component system OmpR family response regulator|nr:response regulator transcription factor [Puniceicoccales bacterium]
MTNQILIAEDDITLGCFLENWLKEAGYAVTRTTNKAGALAAFKPGFYVLAVIDVRMPSARGKKINATAGLEAAAEMRKLDSSLPVLFLSASGNEDIEADALKLHGRGKCDFVRKPCGKKAFQIRVSQIARNTHLLFGPNVSIDQSSRTVIIVGETKPRQLTQQVFDLAMVFHQNENRELTRQKLIDLWGWEAGCLDESISRLRKALNDEQRNLIKTVHGIGYIYKPQNT